MGLRQERNQLNISGDKLIVFIITIEKHEMQE